MIDFTSAIKDQLTLSGLHALANSSQIAGISALLLGVFFIYGVGFAGADIIHSAAHDGRHSIAFPCH